MFEVTLLETLILKNRKVEERLTIIKEFVDPEIKSLAYAANRTILPKVPNMLKKENLLC